MARFSGCRVTVAFDDGRPAFEDDDSDLEVGERGLLLAYWDDAGVVLFAGDEAEPGTFELVARSRPRRCTLRRESARRFVGHWVEGEQGGSLRVELPEAAVDPEETP